MGTHPGVAPAIASTADQAAGLVRLREALGLPAHYEALDRLLADRFGVSRWVLCLRDEGGAPLAVAGGEPAAQPGGRLVAVKRAGQQAAPAGLPPGRLDDLPCAPFPLPAGADLPVAIPFRFRNRPFGLLLVAGADGGAPPAAGVETLAHFSAAELAPLTFREHAIDQVFEDKALFTAKLEYLTEMGKLASNLDLAVLLNKIMELTMEFACAEVGSLILLENDRPVTKLDWGLPHEALVGLSGSDGEPLLDRALQSHEPLWLESGQFTAPQQLPYRFHTVAILPLRTRDSWVGAIVLVVSAFNPEFHPGKLDGLSAGTALAATALENARLFQVKVERERELRNMEIASDIQQALLPRALPDLPGLGVVGANIAAKMIGGDYYDFFPFEDGTLGLIVADVAGKGVAASLIMTSTRMLIRSIAAPEVPTDEVMRRTNLLLQAEACGSQFVTANYVRLDPRRLRLEVCTAGHEPVLVYRPAEDRFIVAQSRALPLGITASATYTIETMPLQPGDLVFLYTDGIIEAMNQQREQFGVERLLDTIRTAWPDSIETIMRTILTAVDWHSAGMPRHDDTTLVVAEIKAVPATPGDAPGATSMGKALSTTTARDEPEA